MTTKANLGNAGSVETMQKSNSVMVEVDGAVRRITLEKFMDAAEWDDKLDTLAAEYYYGVHIDFNSSSPALTRIGRTDLHKTLPIQSRMRRCLLDDNGKVVNYLGATDSTKTDTGMTADLTGASGQVMVEIPEHYRKFKYDDDGNGVSVLLSEYPLPGFNHVRKIYRSAYQATVDRTNLKLCSVVNTTTQYRGGNNMADWDGTYRSELGMPATNISLTNFRTYARNRGTAGLNGKGWNCDLYEANVDTYWLYVVEYANLNSQATFNSQPTSDGYKQGGLGAGVTTLAWDKWTTFNSNNPFVPCGTTNSLGNQTGVVAFTVPAEYDSTTTTTVSVPSYRGIENPFGHIFHWVDGCKCKIQSGADGGKSIFYRAADDDPANFQDSSYTNYNAVGELLRVQSYIKTMLLGDGGDIMASNATGASATTYYCDQFYTTIPASGTELRGVRFGGYASHGSSAGLACANTNTAPSNATTYIGSRLCFIPATDA